MVEDVAVDYVSVEDDVAVEDDVDATYSDWLNVVDAVYSDHSGTKSEYVRHLGHSPPGVVDGVEAGRVDRTFDWSAEAALDSPDDSEARQI